MKTTFVNKANPDSPYIKINAPIDVSYSESDIELLQTKTPLNFDKSKFRVQISTPTTAVSESQKYYLQLYTLRLKYSAWKQINKNFEELT